MRNESMEFVAGALLITFLTANVARARPDLNHPLDTSSPIWATVMMVSNRLPIWPYANSRKPTGNNSLNTRCCSTVNSSPERVIDIAALDQSLIWKDPFRDLDRTVGTPRMFNWSVCSIPTNGSGLLTDSMNHWPLQHTQDPPRLKQVCSHGCVDDDGHGEETQNVNLVAGVTFVDRDATDPGGTSVISAACPT
jgi:hypothetical protein